MTATLYLVRGLPGSGKSTFVKNHITSEQRHLEADMYFYVGKEYRFDPTKLRFAHQWCQDITEACLARGVSVWVSNTFTTMRELKPYLNMASKLNVPVIVYRMETMYGSIHNVPAETIDKMRDRFFDFEGEFVIRG